MEENDFEESDEKIESEEQEESFEEESAEEVFPAEKTEVAEPAVSERSGECRKEEGTVFWVLDETGVLTVYGSGDMANFRVSYFCEACLDRS